MKLYLLRHTKVACEGMCYGQTDVGLADSLEDEKGLVVKSLENIKFQNIYSSPLSRCSILARSVNKHQNEIIFDDRLKELNFGKWEGQNWSDLAKTDEAQLWFKDFVNTTCPEGEAYTDLILRVQDFLSDLDNKESNDNILIVCHGGVIRAFYSIINKIKPEKAFDITIDYGSLMELEIHE